ncbi:MAG: hypothetical protein EHM81_00245 [Chloroflexi bacterium]|nr:MAG: hypothetical protein EHM81_00245 [Chloroflexota bacterium]
MPALKILTDLIGKWQGHNQLWLFPGDPLPESETLADTSLSAQEQLTEFHYTWTEAAALEDVRANVGGGGLKSCLSAWKSVETDWSHWPGLGKRQLSSGERTARPPRWRTWV